jgi:RNA polymerase sigma factor (sigma-70 family)
MMSVHGISSTIRIQRCLQRLGGQDEAARTELLEYSRRRLALLAERMFAQFSILHRHEEVEDLLQEAMLRLWQSLKEVGPTTVAGFMGLAALQMRRALRDMARHHFGRKDETGQGARPVRVSINGNGHSLENHAGDSTWHPDELTSWSEFHAAADRLPEPERTTFDLLYYHQLPHADAAEMMHISERQVRRQWQSARRELHRMLEGFLPKI